MTDRIQKFIKALSEKKRNALKRKLLEIQSDPFSAGNVKTLKGYDGNVYRLRMGDIRVIYEVNENNHVKVLDIDYRGNIY